MAGWRMKKGMGRVLRAAILATTWLCLTPALAAPAFVQANSTEPGSSRTPSPWLPSPLDPPGMVRQPFQWSAQISVKRRRAVS